MTNLVKNNISSKDLATINRSITLMDSVVLNTTNKDLERYLNNVISTLRVDLLWLQGFGE